MRLLQELRDRDGVTSLLTTHLMDEADRCDCVGIVDKGKLVALDTPSALKATVGAEVLTVTTSDPAALAPRVAERFGVSVEVVDGVVRIDCEKGHEFVPDLVGAFPGEVTSVTVGKPTLEDVFIHCTGRHLWDGPSDENPLE